MRKRAYHINDFDPADVAFLQNRLTGIVKGVMNTIMEERVGEIIDQMHAHEWYADTVLRMDFPVEVTGETVLAFLGENRARREIEEADDRKGLAHGHRNDGTVFIYPKHEYASWARTLAENLTVTQMMELIRYWKTEGILTHGAALSAAKASALENTLK